MPNVIEIKIKVDSGEAIAELAGVEAAGKKAGNSADETKGKFSALSNLMSNGLVQSLGKAAGGFAGILGAGGLGGIGAAAGVAGVGLAGFAALAAPTLDKVKNYLSSTGKQAQKAWQQLDPAQRNIATSFKSLETVYSSAAKAFEPVVSSVAKLAVTTGKDLLPAVQTLAPAGAKVISAFLTPLNRLLTSSWFSDWVKQVSNLATQFAPQLGQALVQLLKVVLQLFTALGPSGAGSLVSIITLFTQWVSALTPLLTMGSKVLAWITSMMVKAPLLAAAIALIGAAIAVATGGLSLIIPAIAIAIAAIIHLWDTSQKFREIVTTSFAAVGKVVLTFASLWLDELHIVTNIWLTAVGIIVNGAAQAFGWIPGIGPKLKGAAAAFNTFSGNVNKVFDAAHAKIQDWQAALNKMPKVVQLKGDISDLTSKLNNAKAQLRDPNLSKTYKAYLQAGIDQLTRNIAAARAQLDAINGKTVYTYIQSITVQETVNKHKEAGGVVGAAATGGIRSGLTMVGEHGRELVKLPVGSQVFSNPDTERMMSQGGGSQNITLEVVGGGQSEFERVLVYLLRRYVRVKGGGNVQAAFGYGR